MRQRAVGYRDDIGEKLVGLGGKKIHRAGRAEVRSTQKRSGAARSTSRVWVPIEPVEPTTATRFWVSSRRLSPGRPGPASARRRCGSSDVGQANEAVGRGEHEQKGVDPVHHPAVTGEERSHVLYPEVTLYHRLHKVAARRHDGDDQAEHNGARTCHGWIRLVMPAEAAMATAQPPMSPSQVLFGLMVGARLCLPNRLPIA